MFINQLHEDHGASHRLEGRAAFESGRTVRDNPYGDFRENYTADFWQAGWLQGWYALAYGREYPGASPLEMCRAIQIYRPDLA